MPELRTNLPAVDETMFPGHPVRRSSAFGTVGRGHPDGELVDVVLGVGDGGRDHGGHHHQRHHRRRLRRWRHGDRRSRFSRLFGALACGGVQVPCATGGDRVAGVSGGVHELWPSVTRGLTKPPPPPPSTVLSPDTDTKSLEKNQNNFTWIYQDKNVRTYLQSGPYKIFDKSFDELNQ